MKVLNISIDDSGLCVVTIQEENGTFKKKTVSYSVMLDMLNGSTETSYQREGQIDLSEIFPGDSIISVVQTKHFIEQDIKWYILLREPQPVDFDFYNTIYKNVGVPKLIFAVKTGGGRILSFQIMAVKDRFIRSDTKLYAYPFSNVSVSGTVCTGANYKQINQEIDEVNIFTLFSIPEMFFAMPNSEHSYGNNESGLYYRDLLEELKGKPFNNDYLKDTSVTYESFVRSLH